MQPSELVALARRWLHAFNAQDLEGLLALYADDAVHTSPKLRALRPETKGEVSGKAALRDWWADSMRRLPRLHYRERHLTADETQVVMEYDRENPGEPVSCSEGSRRARSRNTASSWRVIGSASGNGSSPVS